jgi:hypothetical protein
MGNKYEHTYSLHNLSSILHDYSFSNYDTLEVDENDRLVSRSNSQILYIVSYFIVLLFVEKNEFLIATDERTMDR